MRREFRSAGEDAATTAYTFYFQMTNNGGRQACSVKVQASSISDATTFLRQNWPTVEAMARARLTGGAGDEGTIKLAMPR